MLSCSVFDESKTLHHLKHFLPSQSPLKDFVHHNLLHFFQHLSFHEANQRATQIFGYKTYLNIHEFRALYHKGLIEESIIHHTILKHKEPTLLEEYKFRMLYDNVEMNFEGRIGKVMHLWKDHYKVNISKYVQPKLFRIIGNYLDQGIGVIEFPYREGGLLENIRSIEKQSLVSYFLQKDGRARTWLLHNSEQCTLENLLQFLVGDPAWYEDYLFDVSFEHPGWSGIVSVIEDHPEYLIKPREISLKEFLILELLFQIDYLDDRLKEWKPLAHSTMLPVHHLFDPTEEDIHFELLQLWQEALEWTYYFKVLNGLTQHCTVGLSTNPTVPEFQTIHCIDDREESFRRYLEYLCPSAETFSTAGFFNVDAYYQPQHSQYNMKIAPAPVQPKHILKEKSVVVGRDAHTDVQLEMRQESNIKSLLLAQTLGLWSFFQLTQTLFKPQKNPVSISANDHIRPDSSVLCEFDAEVNQWRYGYTIEEITERIEALLKNIGLVQGFSQWIYIISHGAGSTNNPYYAAYDCGACSGKPGSVNARTICFFLNHSKVRQQLQLKNIFIPESTRFIPCLHNTTTDEMIYYDIENLSDEQWTIFQKHQSIFEQALMLNAKERARRFANFYSKNQHPKWVHEKIKIRQNAIFEPRPEYNHATNAICIVGRRQLSRNIFLDRRAFLQSYDYTLDPEGELLADILKAITAVCGGINLEYYYSRTDNQKLGSGSKLSHNVFGLLNVANGAEGDLRIGLPFQMVEIHDPVRLLMIIEQEPSKVFTALSRYPEVMEWYQNKYINLVCLDPIAKKVYEFKGLQGTWDTSFMELTIPLKPIASLSVEELQKMFEVRDENMDVFYLK